MMRFNLLFSGLVTVIGGSCQQSTPGIFYLPEGYVGPVMVIFNQPKGHAEEFVQGKRLYRVPEGGVLRTKFTPVRGYVENDYFYVDGEVVTKAITYVPIVTSANPADTVVFAQETSSGSTKFDSNGTLISSTPNFLVFIVGPLSKGDSLMGAKEVQVFQEVRR